MQKCIKQTYAHKRQLEEKHSSKEVTYYWSLKTASVGKKPKSKSNQNPQSQHSTTTIRSSTNLYQRQIKI